MPIEIKELHIRVTVNAAPGEQPASSQTPAQGTDNTSSDGDSDKDAIIAECVEQVLHILQQKMER